MKTGARGWDSPSLRASPPVLCRMPVRCGLTGEYADAGLHAPRQRSRLLLAGQAPPAGDETFPAGNARGSSHGKGWQLERPTNYVTWDVSR